jgi:ferritin-like metal-binding protein YciE
MSKRRRQKNAALFFCDAPVSPWNRRRRASLSPHIHTKSEARHGQRAEAQNENLTAAFEKHHSETEEQVGRLEQVFDLIEEKPQGKKCAAIEGIIEEGQEIIKEYKGSPALDAGLLAAAQAVEHYEISRYGTLKTWAEELGLNDAVKLLQETLDEEKATDEALTELAEAVVNQEAQAEAA